MRSCPPSLQRPPWCCVPSEVEVAAQVHRVSDPPRASGTHPEQVAPEQPAPVHAKAPPKNLSDVYVQVLLSYTFADEGWPDVFLGQAGDLKLSKVGHFLSAATNVECLVGVLESFEKTLQRYALDPGCILPEVTIIETVAMAIPLFW